MPAFIVAAIAAFQGWLIAVIPGVVARVLGALGIGYIGFSGLNLVSDQIGAFLRAQFGGLPGDMISILNLMGVGTGIEMLISGVIAFFAIKVARGISGAWRTDASVLRA
ncbi:MAG: DUF2523 domain-containing protein [Pseudomonadota bacterium]